MKSHMNWWVKCISTVIAKTASRNVAFKGRKLRDSIMEGQDSFIMREFEDAEVDFGEDGGDVVADVGLSSHCIYPTSRLLLSGPFSSLVLEKMSHEIRLLEKVG